VLRIPLAKTLSAGQTLSLERRRSPAGRTGRSGRALANTTSFHYPSDTTWEERRYRRAVTRRADSIDLRVEFDPECIPPAIWWAVWDGVNGRVIEQHQVQPDTRNSVHRHLRMAEKAVAGFYWQDQTQDQLDSGRPQNDLL
jgi:hypothetical protein